MFIVFKKTERETMSKLHCQDNSTNWAILKNIFRYDKVRSEALLKLGEIISIEQTLKLKINNFAKLIKNQIEKFFNESHIKKLNELEKNG